MDQAFGWLGEIIGWLLTVVPRRIIITPKHQVVAFRYGGLASLLTHENGIAIPNFQIFSLPDPRKWLTSEYWFFRSGLHIYWPVVTRVNRFATYSFPVDMPEQSLTTSDEKSICVSPVLQVKIKDAVKLAVNQPNFEEAISELCIASLADEVGSETWENLKASDISDKLLTRIRREFGGCIGLEIKRATLGSRQIVRPFALWGMGK